MNILASLLSIAMVIRLPPLFVCETMQPAPKYLAFTGDPNFPACTGLQQIATATFVCVLPVPSNACFLKLYDQLVPIMTICSVPAEDSSASSTYSVREDYSQYKSEAGFSACAGIETRDGVDVNCRLPVPSQSCPQALYESLRASTLTVCGRRKEAAKNGYEGSA